MDAQCFITKIVIPTIEDFEANLTSQRHAYLACVATFHTVDYLAYPKRPAGRRDLLRAQSPDFAIVESVALAFKHVETGNMKSASGLLNVDDVIVRPAAVWGTMVWDLSRWDDSTGGITIRNKHEVDLLAVLRRAVQFLRDKILEAESK
jgi:hypothetical protein